MNSFEITSYEPCGGDQCSPYYIKVFSSATVRSVIKDILSNKNEWGSIRIERKSLRDNDHEIEYKYGKLLKDTISEEEKYFWDNISDWKVVNMRGYGGWSSHYHTLSAIYYATLTCTDNIKCYEKEGVTKGNVLGWLNNLKMDKYDYYRDVYQMPSNPIPFDDVISWVKDMYDTDEFVSDFHTNARSVFFKTLDDGTRELRNEIHEKYMGIAVYGMISAKQNHDRMVAKKIAEEKRMAENATVEYYGAVGDKFELTLTFDKSFGFEGAYGFTYIHLFHDDEGHQFKWSSSNGTYKVEYDKTADFGGVEYCDFEVGHKYLMKGTVKAHNEYKGVKQTVITRCKVLDDFHVEESMEDKVIKYDDEKAFDELLNATSETEFEKIVQIA